MLPRQLEPEVMDTREEAVDYNSMDHGEVNRLFAEEVLTLINQISSEIAPHTDRLTLLDSGTGTALIPIEVCNRCAHVDIIATDMAAEMLVVAEDNIQKAGLSKRISLERADVKQLPCADQSIDGVMSNSLIHHIPEPRQAFREMVRVLKPGGFLFVRDLSRPESISELNELVKLHAAEATPHQRQMFHDSLQAALTLDEVHELLKECNLPIESARLTSDRHWTVSLEQSRE